MISLEGVDIPLNLRKPQSCIFINESKKSLKRKIGKSFSGGGQSLEEHRKNGGNVDIDVTCYLARLFIEDDEILNTEFIKPYKSGELLTGDLKNKMTIFIFSILQEIRSQSTEEKESNFRTGYSKIVIYSKWICFNEEGENSKSK